MKKELAYLFILVAQIILFAKAHQRTINSQYQTSSSTIELKQVIVFYRHGLYVPTYNFYNSEYDDYDVIAPPFGRSTYVGNSQSWSLGSYLREQYYSFFEDITAQETIFIMGEYPRSIDMAQHMFSGLVGNYPGWDYETLTEVAIEGVEKQGHCNECSQSLYVPVSEMLEDSSQYTNSSTETTTNIEIKDTDFFDIDEDCVYIDNAQYLFTIKFEDLIEDKFNIVIDDDEYNELTNSLVCDPEDDKDIGLIILMSMYHSHLKQNLGELDFDQESLGKLLSLDVWYWAYDAMFDSMFKSDFKMAQTFDSFIIEDFVDNLYGLETNVEKFRAYMMHDNNLYALYQLIVGDEVDYPNYAANLRILVYEETSEDGEITQYVNALFDGELIDINDCGEECPLSTFHKIMSSYIIDAYEMCDSVESITPAQNKKPLDNLVFSLAFLKLAQQIKKL